MDGAKSGWKQMLAGILQSSTLSPLLYTIYTLDIPKCIYADSICIDDKAKRMRFAHLAVQRRLNEVEIWASRCRISTNVEKTKGVIFSKRTKLQFLVLRLHEILIDYFPRYRYLGVILFGKLIVKH